MPGPEESAELGGRHFGSKLVFTIFFISFGSASFGYCNSVIGSTLGQPSFLSTFGQRTKCRSSHLCDSGCFLRRWHLRSHFSRTVSRSVWPQDICDSRGCHYDHCRSGMHRDQQRRSVYRVPFLLWLVVSFNSVPGKSTRQS